MIRSLSAAALAVGLATAVTGCSSSISASDLEKDVKSELTKSVGQAPDDVNCPDDLKGEKGAETRCTLTDGDLKYGVTVTVTEVDGSNVKFSIKVDDAPTS